MKTKMTNSSFAQKNVQSTKVRTLSTAEMKQVGGSGSVGGGKPRPAGGH